MGGDMEHLQQLLLFKVKRVQSSFEPVLQAFSQRKNSSLCASDITPSI